jgi:DNA invertase Pin-like site-specific DNA recombinase
MDRRIGLDLLDLRGTIIMARKLDIDTPRAPAAYVRISSDRERDELGVTRQRKACRTIAAERGWPEPVIFTDNDLSAADPNVQRPGFLALVDTVRAGEVDAVIAWDMDRLFRQPMELEHFLALADEVGLRHLVTAHDRIDPALGDGLLVARIKAAVAADEIKKLKDRLALKRDELAERGEWGGGAPPYGRGPGMVIREDEAAVIRETASRAVAGESFRSIAVDLSNRGLGPRKGGRWPGGANLAQCVVRPHVAALRQHRGKIIGDASWPAILDRETWQRLVDLRADPSRRASSGAPARMLLTGGVARCAKCNTPMRAAPSAKGVRRYACRAERDFGGGCGGVTRVAQPVDDYVTEAVLTRLEQSDLGSLVQNVDLTALQEQIAIVDEKLAALAARWAADELTEPEWSAARATLTPRKAKLERELAVARRTSAAAALAGPSARRRWAEWDACDDDDEVERNRKLDAKRAVIAELLPDGIALNGVGRGRWRDPFDPKSITLGWFDQEG